MTTEVQSFQSTAGHSSPDRAIPLHAQTLRRAFMVNAIFSGLSGLLFALDSAPIAAFLGIDQTKIFNMLTGSAFILELGIGMLVFAGLVAFTGTRPAINRAAAVAIFVGDAVWVIASIALILTGALPLTVAGSWAVMIAADVVLAFAVWEFIGIRRMG